MTETHKGNIDGLPKKDINAFIRMLGDYRRNTPVLLAPVEVSYTVRNPDGADEEVNLGVISIELAINKAEDLQRKNANVVDFKINGE